MNSSWPALCRPFRLGRHIHSLHQSDAAADVAPPSPPSPPSTCRTCRRSPACGWPPPQAGIRYAGRTDVLLALFDCRHHRGRRVHQIEMPVGAGRMVPRASQIRQSARAGGQFRQCQCLHRQERTGGDQAHRRHRRQGRRLQAVRDFPRLHRRDRRAARRDKIRAGDGRASATARGPATSSPPPARS